MANNQTVENGDVGDFTVETEDQGGGVHRQVVKVAELPTGGLGGTQYTEGDTEAAIVGTAVMWEDAANTLVSVSAAKPLPVDVGTVTVDGSGVTQPISASSLPLPSGASTAANQATANSSLSTIAGDTTSLDSKVTACNTGAVVVSSSALPSGAATEASLASLDGKVTACNTGAVVVSSGTVTANLGVTDNAVLDSIDAAVNGTLVVDGSGVTQPVSGTVTANLSATDNAVLDAIAASVAGTLTVDGSGATQPVSAASLPLPTGAASETTLSTLNGKVTACNTGAVVVSSSALPSGAATAANQSTANSSLSTIAGAVSGTEMQVDLVGSVPAGTNLIGRTSASNETSTVYNGTTALTPKYAVIDEATSGNNTLVAAVVSKKIRVLSLFMVASDAVIARFESGAGGTALTGQMNLAANGGFVLPYNPLGWFETASNTLLNLELSAAVSVDGSLVYVEV